MFFTLTLTFFKLLIYISVPEEPQSPQFNKFPQSRTVDEGSPFKATCALDDVETGRSYIFLLLSYYLPIVRIIRELFFRLFHLHHF